MNKIMSKLLVCALCLTIAVLVCLSTSSPSAHAASARSASSTLSANLKSEAHNTRPYSVIWYNYCPAIYAQYLRITFKNGSVNCFVGSGYLGVPIIQSVVQVEDHIPGNSWFVYYQSGHPGSHKSYVSYGYGVNLNPPVGITQVCLSC